MRMTMFVVAAVLGLAFVSGHASDAWSKDFKITKSHVKNACGDGLQGGGKNFGCTKCDGGLCRDYSCNGSGKGRQGCYETVIKRTGPQTGKGHRPQGQATTSGGRHVPKGSPHPATVNVSGHGPFHGKPIQGVSGVSPDKQDSNPPFDRHGGGRSSNNRRH